MPQKMGNIMSSGMKTAQDLVRKGIFAMTFPAKHGNITTIKENSIALPCMKMVLR